MPQILYKTYNNDVSLLVWQVTESENELLAQLPSKILADSTLDKISLSHLRIEFLAGRLCVYTICKLKDIQFSDIRKDENGKPHLIGNDFEMSLTHSKDYIAVAIHPSKPIGIDIEKPTSKLIKIMPRLFSEHENKQVGDDVVKMSWFWSAKEALYKLYGKRGIDFKENLFLEINNQEFKGEIVLPNYKTHHNFTVEQIFEYYLVIAI